MHIHIQNIQGIIMIQFYSTIVYIWHKQMYLTAYNLNILSTWKTWVSEQLIDNKRCLEQMYWLLSSSTKSLISHWQSKHQSQGLPMAFLGIEFLYKMIVRKENCDEILNEPLLNVYTMLLTCVFKIPFLDYIFIKSCLPEELN